MKSLKFSNFIAVVFVVFLSQLISVSDARAAANGILIGKVCDRTYEPEKPLAGVTVTLKPTVYGYGTHDYVTTTDANGNYRIENIIQGVYTSGGEYTIVCYNVFVEPEGYIGHKGFTIEFENYPTQYDHTVLYQLPANGVVKATVTDAVTGNPIAGANVTLKPTAYGYGTHDYTGTTDANGYCQIDNIIKYTWTSGGARYPTHYNLYVEASGHNTYTSATFDFTQQNPIIMNIYLGQFFVEKTSAFNLGNGFGAMAAAFFDADNDSDLDLYLIKRGYHNWRSYHLQYPNVFLQNTGNFVWMDSSDKSGLASREYGDSCLVFDFDNDSDEDIYLLNYRWGHPGGLVSSPCQLFENKGGGKFVDITSSAGVGTDRTVSNGAVLDYNNDGYLDIIVLGTRMVPEPSLVLYKNNGNKTFTDVTAQAGLIGHIDYGMNLLVSDFNNDTYPDILITTSNKYYLNNGNGTFSEASGWAGLDTSNCTYAAAGDFDNDGFMDILAIGNFDMGGHNHLYRNNGNGSFTDMAENYNLKDVYFRGEIVFVDLDNDGWLDIFNQTDMQALNSNNRQYYFFKNLRGNGFENRSFALGIDPLVDTGGAAYCGFTSWKLFDYDKDGYLDLYLGFENYKSMTGELATSIGKFYENTASDNNYITVNLKGRQSNRDGIGARVTVFAGDLCQTRVYTGHLHSDMNQFTSNIFGLAKNIRPDYIEVKWPSGATQRVLGYNIKGKEITIEEPLPNSVPVISYIRNIYNQVIIWKGVDKEDRLNLKYSYKIDNGAWSEPSRLTTVVIKQISEYLSNGKHKFFVKAIDHQGAESAVKSVDFTVNNPVISIVTEWQVNAYYRTAVYAYKDWQQIKAVYPYIGTNHPNTYICRPLQQTVTLIQYGGGTYSYSQNPDRCREMLKVMINYVTMARDHQVSRVLRQQLSEVLRLLQKEYNRVPR